MSHQEDQSPKSLSVKAGESVSINCITSSGIGYNLSWYQLKPGKAPKLLIYTSSYLASGVPSRFSGTNSGYTFTMKIESVQPEDEGEYYCMGFYPGAVFTQ